ncbi:synaptic vesicle glycoprotein 2B isoform X2 [Drosophila kikkawai]|uniref:Synaptic vesicle glycoprotein 2B isoform X2 n=1 Tax=Drosophila kikkawai TaxID=30033 RepID=A0A6P4IEW4_DROKI|nr:synaptic vesicle glycoprotein 2B [Drosophila kikkawai]
MDNFNQVIDQIGFGSMHLYATITLGLLQMLTIHETMGMGIIGPASVCDLRINQVQLASLTAAGFLGIISSSYFWGYITDKKGRRWTLLRTITVSNVCSIVSMFMVNFSGFFVMRFITGIFVAAPSFVAATYLSEFCSQRILARTLTHMYMFTGFAMLYCPAWAALFLSTKFMEFEVEVAGSLSLRPWRILGCLNILPGVIAFFLLLSLPESPKFLFNIGDTDKGLAAMERICHKNTGKPLSAEQIQSLRIYQSVASARFKRKKSEYNFLRSMIDDAMPLFRKPFLGLFMAACLVMFILGMMANGLGLWYTAMRNRYNMRQGNIKGMSFCRVLFFPEMRPLMETEKDFEPVCNDAFKGFNDSFILGVVYIILYNICWLSLFCVPRKVMFVVSMLISSLCGFLLIFVKDRWVQLFSLVFFLAIPGAVVSLLGGALCLFVPTHLRGKALCISLMWCRCGAALGSILTGSGFHNNCEISLIAIAVLPLIAVGTEGYLPM